MAKNNKKDTINFINIGVPRSGTTWLSEQIKKHPQICQNSSKDLFFFNTSGRSKNPFTSTNKNNYNKGINWYLSHFKLCTKNKLKGEIGTRYLHDANAPQLIKQHFPHIKIIILLRHPINRLLSDYNYNRIKFGLPSFKKTLEQFPEILETSIYSPYLKRYYNTFRKENIHVILFDDIKNSPVKTLQNLYGFLQIDTSFSKNIYLKKINSGDKSFYLILKQIKNGLFTHRINFFQMLSSVIYLILEYILSLIKNDSICQVRIHKTLKKDLLNYYINDIKKTEKLLNKDLTSWKLM